MSRLILFNKPFGVLSQFTGVDGQATLASYINHKTVYAAGRLDKDSEGLLLLTNDGKLQQKIADPKFKMEKTYHAQVDGMISDEAIESLVQGVALNDGLTRPAKVTRIEEPAYLWQREPPVRFRQNIPTSWIELKIMEGRNRQVRRMTAATGFPTLRLIRVAIGTWKLDGLPPGCFTELEV
ncbi:MAG: pseudouridine synthase [Gammaproteobacteria bacterium]|nr:pseudouridine synthase [Gammaproteobacteria bacterium]MDD9895959.1 pseudouridine synthase [Gammaproteobacteria bacterium]MDD9958626.1 pseudouridine synthase [Gammaproteobacteria bacterium]